MPVAAAERSEQPPYGRFPDHIERDWLGRWCHLSEADVSLARRRAGDTTRLGFAAQLVTVRAIGTFQSDPSAVPPPIVASLARQLDVADPGVLLGYSKLAVRWKHTAEIRRRYGYTDFTSEPGHISLLRFLYRQASADDLGPTALFRTAHRRLLAERIVCRASRSWSGWWAVCVSVPPTASGLGWPVPLLPRLSPVWRHSW